MPRFRSSFAAPTGFVAAVTRTKPRASAALVPMSAAAPRATGPVPAAITVTRQAA